MKFEGWCTMMEDGGFLGKILGVDVAWAAQFGGAEVAFVFWINTGRRKMRAAAAAAAPSIIKYYSIHYYHYCSTVL